MIFYKGLAQLFYFLIISGLFFKGELYEFKHCFNYFFEIKHFLCFVPFNIMRTVFLVKVIDTFSAQHMALLKISETAVLFIELVKFVVVTLLFVIFILFDKLLL